MFTSTGTVLLSVTFTSTGTVLSSWGFRGFYDYVLVQYDVSESTFYLCDSGFMCAHLTSVYISIYSEEIFGTLT